MVPVEYREKVSDSIREARYAIPFKDMKRFSFDYKIDALDNYFSKYFNFGHKEKKMLKRIEIFSNTFLWKDSYSLFKAEISTFSGFEVAASYALYFKNKAPIQLEFEFL